MMHERNINLFIYGCLEINNFQTMVEHDTTRSGSIWLRPHNRVRRELIVTEPEFTTLQSGSNTSSIIK
jgi:hypothetical protein